MVSARAVKFLPQIHFDMGYTTIIFISDHVVIKCSTSPIQSSQKDYPLEIAVLQFSVIEFAENFFTMTTI